MNYKHIVVIIAIGAIFINAQNIEAKLGGDTESETFEVIDSNDELLFRIQGDGGLLFNGKNDLGNIPIEGAGVRMMFYDGKGAFRAGWVDGTQWDNANIGATSFAVGQHTTASGTSSSALGESTTASGEYSTSAGYNTIASGSSSIAFGSNTQATGGNSSAFGTNTIASGPFSTTMGYNTTASGNRAIAMGGNSIASGIASTASGSWTLASGSYSTALGWQTTASGNVTTAIGREIEASGENSIAISLNDQNGTNVTQANTMAIMGGNVGVGTISPGSKLSIVGLNEYADNAAAITAGLSVGDLYRTGDLLKIVH